MFFSSGYALKTLYSYIETVGKHGSGFVEIFFSFIEC